MILYGKDKEWPIGDRFEIKGAIYSHTVIYNIQNDSTLLAKRALYDKHIEREYEFISKLKDCSHIINVYDKLQIGKSIWIIMEKGFTDLFDIIDQKISGKQYGFTETETKNVFFQLADAVNFCHDHGVYHRDIKPDNIIVSSNDLETCTVKLIDFGLATDQRFSKDTCGSLLWMPPEAFTFGTRDMKAGDIWSMGVLLFHIMTFSQPWEKATENDKFFKYYVAKKDFTRNYNISIQANELFKCIFFDRCDLALILNVLKTCKKFFIH